MPPRFSILPAQLSAAVSWTGLQGPMSSPVFPVSGSLRAAPPFPRSGPSESGSPTSQVILRCYDFPLTHPRSLIWFASGAHTIPPRFVLASQRSRAEGGLRIRPGSLFSRWSLLPGSLIVWTWVGAPRFPGDPSCAFASVQDPGRPDEPSPVSGLVNAAPAVSKAKASAGDDVEATARL